MDLSASLSSPDRSRFGHRSHGGHRDLGVVGAKWSIGEIPLSELVQFTEAALNDVIIIGAAIFFMLTLEARFKRSKALGSINDLRAIAHVIDMHQMNKDPWIIEGMAESYSFNTNQSMSKLELSLYLDYCSELLSVIGKMAAIYAQHMPEPEVVAAVNEMEALTVGLSRKIWQKLDIVNQHAPALSHEGTGH